MDDEYQFLVSYYEPDIGCSFSLLTASKLERALDLTDCQDDMATMQIQQTTLSSTLCSGS